MRNELDIDGLRVVVGFMLSNESLPLVGQQTSIQYRVGKTLFLLKEFYIVRSSWAICEVEDLADIVSASLSNDRSVPVVEVTLFLQSRVDRCIALNPFLE